MASAMAGPSRPTAPVRSLSDTIPVDVYEMGGGGGGQGARQGQPDTKEAIQGRVSMYVRIVNEMIDTVLEKEAYLLSKHEYGVIQRFRNLPYEPKYLLVRLLLRKTNKIFSYNEMVAKYSAEIGPYLPGAISELVKPLDLEGEVIAGEDVKLQPSELAGEGAQAGPEGKLDSFFTADELRAISAPSRPASPAAHVNAEAGPSRSGSREATPVSPARTAPTSPVPESWRDVSSGLTLAEEKADPALAKAMKLSRFEALKTAAQATAAKGKAKMAAPAVPTEEDFYRMKEGSTDDIVAFARGEEDMEVEEMIKFLPMADLSAIAKDLNVFKSKYNRGEMLQTLLNSATKQSRLTFAPVAGGLRTPTKQSTLPFAPISKTKSASAGGVRTGRSILTGKVIDKLGGRAIQIALPFRLLISRINLIYYRTTITPQAGTAKSLMLPEILTTSHKRAYPSEIEPSRSTIWSTRDALLEYERALEMEAIVDESLGEQNHSTGAWIGPSGFGFGKTGGRIEGAKRVRRVWAGIWDRWKTAAETAGRDKRSRKTGSRHILDRFTLGHILTRVVSKGAVALGILHEYDLECEVLRSLLAQRVWRRGKRGAWYDRLALVLMNHYNGDKEKKAEAVQVCIDALEDDDTHLIYRPRLSRRLTRLEKQLDLPANQRHISLASLAKSTDRKLKAKRVRDPTAKPGGRGKTDPDEQEQDENGNVIPTGGGWASAGKTWWQGREEEVSVEQWVLEWWEDQNHKGYHAEGSILTTLFALLFWPILYTSIPGAFETPYQLAPLDLGDDSFYQSRCEAIEDRLDRMCNKGEALRMLKETDDRERERGTLAIGVRWDFAKEDLEEIVQCLGGRALSVICRMFCEEYGHRASGVPDLIVWQPETKSVRFVEVKSPNDTLSETQKIWISVLLSAGIDVEVCHVLELSDDSAYKGAKKRKLNPRRNNSRGKSEPDYGDDAPGGDGDEGEEDDEFKYESGDEGKGEGRLLSRVETAVVKAEDAEARFKSEERENIAPDAEVRPTALEARQKVQHKRAKMERSRRVRGVLGDSALQPIEIS